MKQIVSLLAEHFGREVASRFHHLQRRIKPSSFPNPTSRATCSAFELVASTPSFVRFPAERSHWVKQTGEFSYIVAKKCLLGLPGIEGKVADCVLLFGAGKFQALPVDVWVTQAPRENTTRSLAGNQHSLPSSAASTSARTASCAQQFLFVWKHRHSLFK